MRIFAQLKEMLLWIVPSNEIQFCRGVSSTDNHPNSVC